MENRTIDEDGTRETIIEDERELRARKVRMKLRMLMSKKWQKKMKSPRLLGNNTAVLKMSRSTY